MSKQKNKVIYYLDMDSDIIYPEDDVKEMISDGDFSEDDELLKVELIGKVKVIKGKDTLKLIK